MLVHYRLNNILIFDIGKVIMGFTKMAMILLLILESCIDDSPITSNEPLEINISNLKHNIISSEIVNDNYYYVKLETKEENLIGTIDKILVINDRILILDNKISKSLYVFDITGTYLNKIGRRGKGPGEYLEINDFDLSSDKNYLYLLDINLKKILKFNIFGEFIHERNFEFYTSGFSCLEDNTFVFYQKNRHNSIKKYNYETIVLDNSLKRVIYSLYPVNSDLLNIGSQHSLYRSGDEIFLCTAFTNEILKIEKYFAETTCKLYKGKYEFQKDKLINPDIRDFISTIESSNYIYNIHNFFKTDSILSFQINQGRTSYTIFYSLLSGKMVYASAFSVDSMIGNPCKIIGVYNNTFISYIIPYRVAKKKDILQKLYDKKTNTVDYDLIKDISPTDNPILFFFSIKNDFL